MPRGFYVKSSVRATRGDPSGSSEAGQSAKVALNDTSLANLNITVDNEDAFRRKYPQSDTRRLVNLIEALKSGWTNGVVGNNGVRVSYRFLHADCANHSIAGISGPDHILKEAAKSLLDHTYVGLTFEGPTRKKKSRDKTYWFALKTVVEYQLPRPPSPAPAS